jgi:triosephosphate isomerase (TIM)
MSQSDRSVVIAGNWKMYMTIEQSVAFVKELTPLVANAHPKVYLAVPFTDIAPAAEQTKGTNIVIGAQNMNDASEGAFTGEIAGKMIKNAGAQFVILGHSERRKIFHETNEFISRKVKRALTDDLQIIVCFGETLAEKDENKTEEVIHTQIIECLADITAEQLDSVILAYEPIWAIGSDNTATPELAQNVHHFCRDLISKTWNEEVAHKIVIQYGGSVKPDNAKALMEQSDIDGLLVGGASLSVESFSKIVNYQNF